jgi:hypothetical protein
MPQSEKIDKFAAALAKAQGAFGGVRVSATSVWDMCRKPLADNGLSVQQTIELRDGAASIMTSIVHDASGQKIWSEQTVQPRADGRVGP